jgi:hypothetical protein
VGAIEPIGSTELESRIPVGLMTAATHRVLVDSFCFCLGCLALSAFDNRNGWIYFLGSILGPALAAAYFMLKPFNPYRTPAAKFSGMTDRDERDPECKRLRLFMASAAARGLLIKVAIKLSVIFVLAMLVIAAVQSKPLVWTLHGDEIKWFPLLILMCSAVMIPIYVNSLVLWCLQNWSAETRQMKD